MNIYYLMIEAVPDKSNPESKQFGGAFINFWVKTETVKEALEETKKYISEENWKYIKTEEMFIVERDFYIDNPESLEYYDNACECGMSVCFYMWLKK